MFGVDVLSSVPISHLLMAEVKTFNATEFDIDKTNPVFGTIEAKWVDSTNSYHFKAYGMDDWADTGQMDADKVTSNQEIQTKIAAGQGLSFASLSPNDDGTETGTGTGEKDCSTENREAVAGDTNTCGSCLSGYVEDETGVCVAETSVTADVANTETNWLLYGVIGAGLVGGIFYFR
jgi:hypothetical protein